VIKKQESLEEMLIEQKDQISEIMTLLKNNEQKNSEISIGGAKGKKTKRRGEFYQVNIYSVLYYYFFILFDSFINYLYYRTQLKSLLMKYFMSISK
jgi:hypothetical protein